MKKTVERPIENSYNIRNYPFIKYEYENNQIFVELMPSGTKISPIYFVSRRCVKCLLNYLINSCVVSYFDGAISFTEAHMYGRNITQECFERSWLLENDAM